MWGRIVVGAALVAICLAGASPSHVTRLQTPRRSELSLALVPMRDRAEPLLPSTQGHAVDAAIPVEFSYGAATARPSALWHLGPDGQARCLFRGVLAPAIPGYGTIAVADGRLGYDFGGEPGRHDFVLVAGASLPATDELQRIVQRSAAASLAWGEVMVAGTRLSWERVRVVVAD